MKIVIDARMLNAAGIGRYLRNLLNELQKLDDINEYYILLLQSDYDTLVYHSENFHKVLADFKWYTVAEQVRLPWILKQIDADLVHFPHFNVPVFYKGKYVVTIHDLIHQHRSNKAATTRDPITFKLKKMGYNLVFKKAISKSQAILTPSEFVKDQLIKELHVNGNKVMVTPEGVDPIIHSIGDKMGGGKALEILEKLEVKKPYIFYVGNAHPHKNVEGLIQAFLNMESRIKNHESNGLQLVLSGQQSPFWDRIKKNLDSRFRGNDEITRDIILTGLITDEELAVLYKNAKCFVMPSFEEGFGIPILEAMALGCPVVSSNAGSLPEVGGDAALYFDPGDLGDMGDKIEKVLSSEKLKKELIEKGKKRVKQFSWQKMARETLEVYNDVLKSSRA